MSRPPAISIRPSLRVVDVWPLRALTIGTFAIAAARAALSCFCGVIELAPLDQENTWRNLSKPPEEAEAATAPAVIVSSANARTKRVRGLMLLMLKRVLPLIGSLLLNMGVISCRGAAAGWGAFDLEDSGRELRSIFVDFHLIRTSPLKRLPALGS
jgi:hypothetical protein